MVVILISSGNTKDRKVESHLEFPSSHFVLFLARNSVAILRSCLENPFISKLNRHAFDADGDLISAEVFWR